MSVTVEIQLKKVISLEELTYKDADGHILRMCGKDYFIRNSEGGFDRYGITLHTTRALLEKCIEQGLVYVMEPDFMVQIEIKNEE